jgi:(p)ppGpp synthase/HD superfamily hydrolase
MQAFDSQKLGAEWIKHLMDTTAKYSNNKPQAIKEHIAKMRPLLKEATVEQQYKMLKLMKEAYQVNEYTVRNTKKFIQRAHDTEQGQKYGSAPYSSHPKAVANIGKKFFGTQFTPEAIKVALLHDVLEDTPYTPQQLAKKGFSKEVIQAVQLLTKNKNLSYADNIKNIINSGNKLAMMVKYSDNYMNYNGDKSHWDSERANHSNKKYLASLNMLGDVLGIKKHLGNEESNVTESTDYLEEK